MDKMDRNILVIDTSLDESVELWSEFIIPAVKEYIEKRTAALPTNQL